MRSACYHARHAPNYGRRVLVLTQAKRGTHPRNVLIQFSTGERTVTSIGCIRWKCLKHPQGVSHG
jgi:hypothetical protein